MPLFARDRAAAVALAVVASLSAGGCQSAPAPNDLIDPREILAAAATSTLAAKTARIDATADGTVAIDLLGLGAASSVELTGTTASADLDLERSNARVTFSAPGLLGLTGELIVLDGTSYLRTTLTGALYQVSPLGAATPAPSGASASILAGLAGLLERPELRPVKGDDAPCGGTTCYRVDITLTSADLAALGAGDLRAPTGLPVPIPIPDLSTATADLTILVAKDTTRLTGLKAVIDLGQAGKATVDLTFSKWDQPVSISAPPADQLAPTG